MCVCVGAILQIVRIHTSRLFFFRAGQASTIEFSQVGIMTCMQRKPMCMYVYMKERLPIPIYVGSCRYLSARRLQTASDPERSYCCRDNMAREALLLSESVASLKVLAADAGTASVDHNLCIHTCIHLLS